jgi:hypothetical protein
MDRQGTSLKSERNLQASQLCRLNLDHQSQEQEGNRFECPSGTTIHQNEEDKRETRNVMLYLHSSARRTPQIRTRSLREATFRTINK